MRLLPVACTPCYVRNLVCVVCSVWTRMTFARPVLARYVSSLGVTQTRPLEPAPLGPLPGPLGERLVANNLLWTLDFSATIQPQLVVSTL